MKRLLIILFIGVSILSLYSFEYADDERYMTFISINKQEFYVLDTINSIYKFCITVSEDSDHVIGREISYGRIKKTDSTFIIYGTECLFARFFISNDKHVKKGTTRIILLDSYLNDSVINVSRIAFYGKDSDSIIYEDGAFIGDLNVSVTLKTPSGCNFNLPMIVDSLKVCYSKGCTPLIELNAPEIRQKSHEAYKNVIIYWDKPKKGAQRYNDIIIDFQAPPPGYNEYHWSDKDSLEMYMAPSLGPGHYHVVMTREKRRILTYKR